MTNCPRSTCKNKAIIHPTFGVLPCQACRNNDDKVAKPVTPEFYSMSKSNRIQGQRDHFNKDILQPYDAHGKPNRDFVLAYPEQRKNYFSSEDLKKL